MHRLLKRLVGEQSGVALIEFVLVLPVLLFLFIGAMELTRYVLILMKVQKSAYVLTDIIGQYPPATADRKAGEINETELQSVLAKFENLVGGAPTTRVAIVTSIQQVGTGSPTIRWQQSGGGTLTTDVVSLPTGLGPCGTCRTVGGTKTVLPAAYDLSGIRANENVIIGEVYYRYEPMMQPLLQYFGFTFGPRTINRSLFMAPRNGNLICLPNTFVYASEC